jgi:cytidylate kinase
MVFVIDGPAGSGKSSTAREIARRLSITYLDSGAVYRAVTWLRQRTGEDGFFDVLKSSTLSFQHAEGVFRISVNGIDVTQAIRTPEIDAGVSAVAADGRIRDIVNGLLREATRDGYYIADGRDLGTVVFPDAAVKIYMVADINTRAQRRYAEQQQSGISRDEIAKGLQQRDHLDSTREVAPLRKADDAIEVDTTSCTFEEQVAAIEEKIKPFLTEANQNSSRLNKAEVLNNKP